MNSDLHVAWDYGVVTESFLADPKQKTIKTQCGKRVKIDDIDNEEPTCPVCIEHLKECDRVAQLLEGDI